ncbi:MAG: NAD(P)H-hydrate dehydratase [Pseudomonadota bacterium]
MRASLIRRLAKAGTAHKYSHGHALVLAGGSAQTGAARLAARGALRIGAGLVTLAPPKASLFECAVQSTAVMVRGCDSAEDLAAILEDRRVNALCLGPGLGVRRARTLLDAALARAGDTSFAGCVLDADALTALAMDMRPVAARCVLTPHGGEFSRLFPDLAQTREGVRAAADRVGCVVLLKGSETLVASPDGGLAHVRAEAPWLATAGSGDVLAGFITGLLARGFSPMDAAEAGADLHGACARAFGPGLIAEDIPDLLPQVFRDLGL